MKIHIWLLSILLAIILNTTSKAQNPDFDDQRVYSMQDPGIFLEWNVFTQSAGGYNYEYISVGVANGPNEYALVMNFYDVNYDLVYSKKITSDGACNPGVGGPGHGWMPVPKEIIEDTDGNLVVTGIDRRFYNWPLGPIVAKDHGFILKVNPYANQVYYYQLFTTDEDNESGLYSIIEQGDYYYMCGYVDPHDTIVVAYDTVFAGRVPYLVRISKDGVNSNSSIGRYSYYWIQFFGELTDLRYDNTTSSIQTIGHGMYYRRDLDISQKVIYHWGLNLSLSSGPAYRYILNSQFYDRSLIETVSMEIIDNTIYVNLNNLNLSYNTCFAKFPIDGPQMTMREYVSGTDKGFISFDLTVGSDGNIYTCGIHNRMLGDPPFGMIDSYIMSVDTNLYLNFLECENEFYRYSFLNKIFENDSNEIWAGGETHPIEEPQFPHGAYICREHSNKEFHCTDSLFSNKITETYSRDYASTTAHTYFRCDDDSITIEEIELDQLELCEDTLSVPDTLEPDARRISLDILESVGSIKLSPNPAFDELKVQFYLGESNDAIITIYDLIGNKQYYIDLGTVNQGINSRIIDIQKLTSGNYYLQIKFGGHTISQKFSVIK